MGRRMMPIAALVVGCQAPAHGVKGDAAASGSDPPTTCTQLGAPCTFAPGKLGSCVEIERPEGPSSFVCQSQH
jgi:hypothetical protein